MSGSTESLEEFYKQKFKDLSENFKKDIGQFNVFRIEDRIAEGVTSPSYIRRDFYKIMLFQGKNVFHYADKSIEVSNNTLLFFNPRVPYTYDVLDPDTKGYFCVFKEEFFHESFRINLNELPLFSTGTVPVFKLDPALNSEVESIFKKIFNTLNTDYIYKYELIKSYVSELIYLSIQLKPIEEVFQHPDASSRITTLFIELLERQFPIDSTLQRFELRSPKAIADRLSIHVNYLNRAVKKHSGRTTTEHVFERLIAEAKILLKHTNWNIAEISYVLGFEDQAHFNKFFKKNTKVNPSAFRQV
ncbi:AraC family transcriptional regulator [Flavobacterium sp. ANB]|uniref:helix-turn-helix domain-containing protein n=1 Tax=unclassified Flavobacterium TaxID=196869 RepID=UPI0012B7A190|nr:MULTISPECIES: AraC family transcriptional regulator [unclassified Flavobacterium]MBF4516988.1 AraC family transcriptional regulator [Flavobacterium sp. ANB]MTD69116.1 helix-turn-helix domain-containing protein [Flavobacterium sp. LC2016-13]